MSDRGDYRSFYRSFWDDPDVHALSDRGYRVLTTLKGVLNAAGIGVVYELQLCQQCRCTPAELEEAMRELATPKAGAEFGWIVRERNVVWLVNGLRFSPNLSAKDAKHRSFIRKLVAPLGDRRPIVRAFWAHYPDWLEGATAPAPDSPNGGPSKGLRRGREGVSKHIAIPSHPVDVAITSEAPRAREEDPAPEPAALPGAALRLLDRYYGACPAERRDQVTRDLLATLNGGATYRRRTVRARSAAHLEQVCAAVLASPPRKPDAAIALVMVKLTDPELDGAGRTVTEAASARYHDDERLAAEYQRARREAVDAWGARNPELLAEVERGARATCELAPDVPLEQLEPWQRMALTAAIDQAVAARLGWPDCDAWVARKRLKVS